MTNRSSSLTQRQQQAAETKLKIYRNTISLYQQKPYDTVTIADICEVSGISVGSFYHYFKDKDDVLNQGFLSIAQRLSERIKNISLPPLEQLLLIVKFYAECWEEAGFRFMSVSLHNEVLRLISYKNNPERPTYQYMLTLLEEAFENGSLINGDPDVVHSDMVRAMKGTCYDWIIRKGCFSLADETERMIQLILRPYYPDK